MKLNELLLNLESGEELTVFYWETDEEVYAGTWFNSFDVNYIEDEEEMEKWENNKPEYAEKSERFLSEFGEKEVRLFVSGSDGEDGSCLNIFIWKN